MFFRCPPLLSTQAAPSLSPRTLSLSFARESLQRQNLRDFLSIMLLFPLVVVAIFPQYLRVPPSFFSAFSHSPLFPRCWCGAAGFEKAMLLSQRPQQEQGPPLQPVKAPTFWLMLSSSRPSATFLRERRRSLAT